MMTRAIVVNCSAPYYNLGARKLVDWQRAQGHDVTCYDGDAWFDGKQRVWSGSKDAARAAGATIYQWVRVAAHCHEPEGGAWATETDVARGYVRLGCGLCDTMAICGDDVKILESAQEATDVP